MKRACPREWLVNPRAAQAINAMMEQAMSPERIAELLAEGILEKQSFYIKGRRPVAHAAPRSEPSPDMRTRVPAACDVG